MNDEVDKEYLVNDEHIRELEHFYEAAKRALPKVEVNNGIPEYPREIRSFMFRLIDQPWCSVAEFNATSDLDGVLRRIDGASVEDCCRAIICAGKLEKYGDGQWYAVLERDLLRPVINRLKVLKKDSAEKLN
jgi:hypothetical protein